jgi:hypothetical protein
MNCFTGNNSPPAAILPAEFKTIGFECAIVPETDVKTVCGVVVPAL